MRVFFVMLKKEIIENFKKSRFFVIAVVLLIFGILSPLTAKYLHEIIDFVLNTSGEVNPFPIDLPTPTINDSYIQYYSNLAQMGIFVQILVFMGIVSDEKSKNTAILVLTKSVPRHTFLISKFVAGLIVIVSTMIPSYLAFYYYTYLLFDKVPSNMAFVGVLMYLLFAVFIFAYTLFASTVTSKTSISALIALGGYFAMSIISAIPVVKDYFPVNLTQASYMISMGISKVGDFSKSIVITILGTFALLIISIFVFKKQEL